MEPPSEPFGALLNIFLPFTFGTAIYLLVMVVLIIGSGLISGSEIAYFSLSPSDKDDLKKENSNRGGRVLALLDSPKKLLATILIANNFINVAIVLVSTLIMERVLNNSGMSTTLIFVINVVLVTFIILLFGEVLPKVHATRQSVKLAKLMSGTLTVCQTILSPFSRLLIASTSVIDKRFKKRTESISVDALGHALDLTKEDVDSPEEKKLLEGIVKFGNTDAKQIMKPRTDVVALSGELEFKALLTEIGNHKYSRLPVYTESIDQITGILYIKDLLVYVDEENEFDWLSILRKPKFIPENKKLDDLLEEFKDEKMHLAVVVDEYGGTSGIVTLEDVLEEIIGDITDEFDDDDIVFSKLDDKNFVFEGKTGLMDMYRILEISGDAFEEVKGESDTIAGFCIEQAGKILLKNEKIDFECYTFTIESSDKRRIKQVKVTINE